MSDTENQPRDKNGKQTSGGGALSQLAEHNGAVAKNQKVDAIPVHHDLQIKRLCQARNFQRAERVPDEVQKGVRRDPINQHRVEGIDE